MPPVDTHRSAVATAATMPMSCAAAALPVGYRIEARLDPDRKEVSGREVLTWTNYAPDPVDRLMFHLYMNAFADKKYDQAAAYLKKAKELDPKAYGEKADSLLKRIEALK